MSLTIIDSIVRATCGLNCRLQPGCLNETGLPAASVMLMIGRGGQNTPSLAMAE